MGSKSYRVVVAPAAIGDLKSAVNYYLRVAGESSAARLVERFENVIAYLEEVPSAAARIGNTGYHWLPVGSFVLAYTFDESEKAVNVLRLHCESANWREMIERRNDDE